MTADDINRLVPEWMLRSRFYSIVITDLDGCYTFVNEVFSERFSFLTDDFIGKPFLATIYADDRESCNDAFRECVSNPGTTVGVKVRQPVTRGGLFFWTEWELTLCYDDLKKPIGIMCIGHDVTQMERALFRERTLANKVENIIENITDGFYILDRSWRFVKVNKVAEKLLGIERDLLLGQIFWEVFPNDSRFNYSEQYHKAITEYVTVSFEDYRHDLDRWYSAVAYPSTEGLTVFFRDITESKRISEKLVESENKLKAILDSGNDSTVLIDADFKILIFNRIAEEGARNFLKKDIKVGDDFRQFIVPGREDSFYSSFAKAANGKRVKADWELKIKNSSVWFELTYYPVYDHSGKFFGVAFNSANVDVRKKFELRIQEQNERLKSIAWKQSHEVRTPLTSIMAIVNEIREETDLCEKERYLNDLEGEAHNLDKIIHKIVEEAFKENGNNEVKNTR